MKKSLALWVLILSVSKVLAQTVTAPETFNLTYYLNQERIGITLNLGSGTVAEPYLFDTGSPDLTSGWTNGVAWWPAGTTAGTPATPLVYGPGSGTQKFDANNSDQTVVLSQGSNSLNDTTVVKQITAGYTNSTPSVSPANWQSDASFNDALSSAATNSSIHPFSGTFNGTLGADLTDLTAGGFARLVNTQTYAAGLDTGFIVNASLSAPSITVGLQSNTIAGFSNTFAMNKIGSAIQLHVISADYGFAHGVDSATVSSVPTLLDTGTPPSSGVFLTTGTALTIDSKYLDVSGNYLKDGTSFTMLLGGTPYTLTSTAGNRISVFASQDGVGGVTYGLNFFQNYQVMYDLTTSTVGIQAVPEPDSMLLLLLAGGLVATSLVWQRRNLLGL